MVIGASFTKEDAKAERDRVRCAAEQAGRNPDEVSSVAGIMPTIAPTVLEALDRRGMFVEPEIGARIRYLGAMLSIPLSRKDIDAPLSETSCTPRTQALAIPDPIMHTSWHTKAGPSATFSTTA